MESSVKQIQSSEKSRHTVDQRNRARISLWWKLCYEQEVRISVGNEHSRHGKTSTPNVQRKL